MSKAEERALETFPLKIDGDSRGSYDFNAVTRIIYQQGYEQAEKDLELTWEDIKKIYFLFKDVRNEWQEYEFNDCGICREVLKRFKEKKQI